MSINGTHTTNGTPHGYTSITPFIALTDPAGALAFYQDVFGARLVNSTVVGDAIIHAELEFASGRLQVGAASPEYALVASDDAPYSLGLYCPDVDAVVARALAAGATLREELATFVSGDRYASIRDPFGVRWSIMTRVEDLSDEESAQRVKDFFANQE